MGLWIPYSEKYQYVVCPTRNETGSDIRAIFNYFLRFFENLQPL